MSRSQHDDLPLSNLNSGRARKSSYDQVYDETFHSQGKPPTTFAAGRAGTYSSKTVAETAEQLSTSPVHGLRPEEARTRYHRDGPNELPRELPEPLWMRFLKQFKETLILLLLASAAVSALMGNYEDAVSITIAVTIVVTVAFVQEYRSEQSIEALDRLVPHAANVIRSQPHPSTLPAKVSPTAENSEQLIMHLDISAAQRASTKTSASQVVCGDLVLFATGDRIPADIRITHCADLTIDESNLTGENEPVYKTSDVMQPTATSQNTNLTPLYSCTSDHTMPASGAVGVDVRLNEQRNMTFMGTLVRSGYGQGIVIATGGQTEFGAISASLQEIESPRTPLQLSMDRLGQELSYMSFGVIAFIILIGLWRGSRLLELFQIGVSLAVAAIPEGLPIIVTVTLALGVLRMSKRNAMVRRLPSVETLGSVDIICSDKTGTLTMNHMTVTKLWSLGETKALDVHTLLSATPPNDALRAVMRIGNVVNNGRLRNGAAESATIASAAVLSSTAGDETAIHQSRWAGQPTDVALLDLVDAFSLDDARDRVGSRQSETPFSSERKWMGCVIAHPANDNGKLIAYIKGAIERVISRCDTYTSEHGSEVVLDDRGRQEILQAAESMADEGLRVLGFASGPVAVNKNNTSSASRRASAAQDDTAYQGLCFAGLVGMNDPPRKGVDKSIRRLMAGGVKVVMITGDAEKTAVAIARKLGMPINMSSAIGSPVLSGADMDRMTDEEMDSAVEHTQVYARTSPDHKMKIISALQRRGHVVAMTGDGVNDAPALKKADIGISMGKLGTDVAKEAADMVLTDDDFSTILRAIEEGKSIFSNIQNFLTFQLSTSAAALGLVMLSSAFGYKNPLNAMQILWISEWALRRCLRQVLIVSRYPHGRTTCPVSRRRAGGSESAQSSTEITTCKSHHRPPHTTCTTVGQCHCRWHTIHVYQQLVNRGSCSALGIRA